MFDFLRMVRSAMTGESNEEVLQEGSQEGQVEVKGQDGQQAIMDEAAIQEGLAPSDPSESESKIDSRPRNIEGFPYEEFPGCRFNTRTKLIDRTDYPAQIYPWMLDCSCGFQARLFTKNEALAVGERHLGRRMEVEA